MSEIRSDFPGGNVTNFEWLSPDLLRFEADPRGGLYAMWFHFVVEEPNSDLLQCELTNGPKSLGWPYQPYVRPVFRRAGEEWQRVPPTTLDPGTSAFQFSVSCQRSTTEIAFCYPYQLGDWNAFFGQHLAAAGGRIVELGEAEAGARLFAVEVGQGPKRILLTSRAHSGETPGTYTLEGILTGLIATGLEGLTVCAIPFLDAVGVINGMYGKERPPVDFNRAWVEDRTRPEILVYKDYLGSLPEPPVVAVDCHAPTATDPHCIECSSYPGAPADFADRLGRLVQTIAQACAMEPASALCMGKTHPHPGWYPDGFERSLSGHLQSTYGTLAFTMESAYHATHQGVTTSPSAWRMQGQLIAEGILSFLHAEG